MTNTYFFVDDNGEISTITEDELKKIAVGCWANGALDITTITTGEAENIVSNSDHCDAQNVCFDLEDALALRESRNHDANTIISINGEIHTLEINREDNACVNVADDYLSNAGDWKRISGNAWQADDPADLDQFREWLHNVCVTEDGCDVYLDNEQIQ